MSGKLPLIAQHRWVKGFKEHHLVSLFFGPAADAFSASAVAGLRRRA
jgi:hypothetical protein